MSALPSGPTPGTIPTVNALTSGWAIISFAEPGTPLSERNMIHRPSGE
jgi:hypothetical protein